MRQRLKHRGAVLAASLITASMLAGCERTQVEQRGYRGLGMVENYRPATIEKQEEINKVPVALRKANPSGVTAAEEYENVRVLGDLSKSEFARLMLSFKTWLAPEEGCNLCHNAPDYASDAKYQKAVAREMIRMTRRINSDWKAHVADTGVTCFTCHRGQPVPAKIWFAAPEREQAGFFTRKSGASAPTPSASRTTLPNDPMSDYLLNDKPIRFVGLTALQTGNTNSIKQAQSTYALMLLMSESLGVNCTYCHNTRAFYSWELSPPPRATAWYGIRMARDINRNFMVPLAANLPAERMGPAEDGPKVYCATCHQGSSKPLNGVNMVKDFPELIGPKQSPAVAAPSATASVAGKS